ncbi:hemolysin family protein [Pinibacter aurantiacus]|uniref:Hemolysin family protein n=1 Tax=Pinibacter aurantiacus TaxID=2851599 RepID=A0A9E2SAU9_9BACT|nr:hemolysin family protein [Pinibacter aurantiacus]MBV4357809.1 hemolysin family protein [Pinibacter aurantiacus]
MINLYTFIWIIVSILLTGFFVGINIAFVNLNRLSVELRKKQGKTGGKIISAYFDHPVQFIGATLIGLNISLVVYGVLIGEMLDPWWNMLIIKEHIPGNYVNFVRLLCETLVSTIIIVLLGSFLPYAVWRSKNEMLLSGFVSRIVQFFYSLLSPLVNFFIYISEWILKYLFNIRVDERKEAFVRADLDYFFQHNGEQDMESTDLNTELFENALSLPNIKVRQCLVPRKEIEGVDAKLSIGELKKKFISTKLSKLVVYEENIDHIVGYVHQLDLFKKPQDIKSILHPIPAVPQSMSVSDLINKFTLERKSIAWVVDEFGGTAGIVTMEDLLEEIFGDIRDEYDTEEFEEKKLSDEEYILSGRLELDYLNEKYGLEFPEKESETLSGYIIQQHETIPKAKDRIIIGNYEFDVMSVSDTRIEMVKMKVLNS